MLPPGRGHGALDLGQLARRPHRRHAGQSLGGRHVYLNDAGVGMAAPHHGHVELAGAGEVVHETAGARDEPPVFLAQW
jgi:hypothetical protein